MVTADNSVESAEKLRDFFLGWQCRLRQHAVRKLDGRPSEGMRAGVRVAISDNNLGPVNVLLVRRDPQIWTDELRHLVKKTHDPNERVKAALKILASSYYQHPREFDDRLVATFLLDSELAALLVEQRECELSFEQYRQTFYLVCRVVELAEADPAYQAAYWHNSLFNSTMPGRVCMLQFQPDWEQSRASS
jgi:hypothetical protein